jgi:LmbE family N-acetylglucosaminyl deacetylase
MARVARGDYGRVAYLSLNRGEGGQNVIGPELFDALGVIRTEELLQARTLDGGEQFFTQTFDYGFSKTLTEAAATWGEENVLRDMVRVIRMYRPLVIYSRFSGNTGDGHGHHQLAGRLTPEAYRAAADPARFPEQLAEGLRPWRARKLYRGAGFRPAPGTTITTRIDTGRFDPLIGRSYFEIAAEGRSQHKSQEMGVPESRGRRAGNQRLRRPRYVAGRTAHAGRTARRRPAGRYGGGGPRAGGCRRGLRCPAARRRPPRPG